MKYPKLDNQRSQSGAVLIILMFFVGLVATTIAVKSLNTASNIRFSQEDKSIKILAEAKEALIGYSVSRISAGERPGDMPSPDRLLSPIETPPASGPPNFDGAIDSCTDVGTSTMRCFGRLPWQAIGMVISNPSQNDVLGVMPWYAASANLVDVCLKILNTSILNYAYSGTYPAGCPGTPVTGVLPHPWLTVRDAKGNVLSDRVAFVIILPGLPINSQARPESPLNDATSYLEGENADNDNVYVTTSNITGVYSDINDRLIYVTIDELMTQVVKRAGLGVKKGLEDYNAAFGHYPYAAPINATGDNFVSTASSDEGMLPADGSHTIDCTSADRCSYDDLNLFTNIQHTRTTGSTYTSTSGYCTRSSRTCTCTGIGYCLRPFLARFECTATDCQYTLGGGASRKTTFNLKPTYANALDKIVENSCTYTEPTKSVVCNGAGMANFSFVVPDWFRENLWKEYFYYTFDNLANIQVGNKTGVEALLIGVGNAITTSPFALSTSPDTPPDPLTGHAQVKPASTINDFLDSIKNTDGDNQFDESNVRHSSNYNDQSIIISP